MPVTTSHLTDGGDDTNGTSFSTASVAPSPNRLILLAFSVRSPGSAIQVSSVSGCGLTWELVNASPNDTNQRTYLYRALGASPTAGAITIGFTATMSCLAWSVDEFGNVDQSGSNGSGAVVQSATGQVSFPATTLTITLAAFGSVDNATYGALGRSGRGAITPGSGFTELAEAKPPTEADAVQVQWRADNDTSVDWSFPADFAGSRGIAIEIKFAANPGDIRALVYDPIEDRLFIELSGTNPTLKQVATAAAVAVNAWNGQFSTLTSPTITVPTDGRNMALVRN